MAAYTWLTKQSTSVSYENILAWAVVKYFQFSNNVANTVIPLINKAVLSLKLLYVHVATYYNYGTYLVTL